MSLLLLSAFAVQVSALLCVDMGMRSAPSAGDVTVLLGDTRARAGLGALFTFGKWPACKRHGEGRGRDVCRRPARSPRHMLPELDPALHSGPGPAWKACTTELQLCASGRMATPSASRLAMQEALCPAWHV